MAEPQQGDGTRLDRIEKAILRLIETQSNQEARLDRLTQDCHQLLTAQIFLTDAQRKAEEKIGMLADFQTRLADFQTRLADFQTRLADSQAQLSESQQRFEATYQRLVETQQHTDERLNALIQIVDEIIRRRPPESA